MSLPTTEFLFFKASDAFKADPEGTTKGVFDIVLKKAGSQSPAFVGAQIDESETRKAEGLTYNLGYVFLHWDTWQHHQDIIEAPDYPNVLNALVPAVAGGDPAKAGATMYHLENWNSSPQPALKDSKTTEVLIIELKAPEHRARVEEILQALSDGTKGLLVFSKAKEAPETYVVVAGWDSPQHHWDTIKAPEIDAALKELYSLAPKQNGHIFHTELKQVS
ncbi:hypothetical protein CONPUDRAFT_92767 [Coniophora puteana RWD-64-598 SS2]|uniref:ABM domain-containing protein n=1 Tax=Coniophora puteana (strain RWD-64-598) TaxID=741705 RepID=A0A5M3MDF4_CONPW|nr:uncharacterized protein CONPUDRAFT_92767 [Coniophora puteana RWD-64-598 SS2]EIW76900.1 hypothetical protein CONPUDRAFT_92767 [Coniophora puteana RWD-64-598 SS2]